MTILINLFLAIWILVALLMVLIILMQRPKSEGLGAAFGGGVTENIFGAQTTTVLTKITGWLAGIFFFLTFLLSVLYAHRGRGESALSRQLKEGAAAPAASASPVTGIAPSTPLPPGAAIPTGSARPSDMAVGAVPPASAPLMSTAASTASPAASAAATATPRKRR